MTKRYLAQQYKKFMILILCLGYVGLGSSPAFAKLSNDPLVQQWSYEHVGAYHAWDYTTGSRNVVVAVIDNGFDSFHPDLFANLWVNQDEIANNGMDDDSNGYADDVYGWNFVDNTNDPRPDPIGLPTADREEGIIHHGTVVAGIIGAVGNNELDGAGINWNVRLMNLKAVNNSGTGPLSPLREAIYYAVDNGANIINISMVGGEDVGLSEAVAYAHDKGVAVISAAGNNRADLEITPYYPVCADSGKTGEQTLGVSAIGENHRLANFSNVGSNCVDITAPGVDVASTVRFSPTNGLLERYRDGWDGTSFSTPFVSGAAALIKSIQPTWSADQIYSALLSTTQHTPGQDEDVYADLFGAGLLQIDRAVTYAMDRGGVAPQENGRQTPTADINSRAFLVVDTHNGTVESRDSMNVVVETSKQVNTIKDADDVVGFHDGFEWKYVVTKKNDSNSRVVSVYNAQWSGLSSWNVASTVPLDITVGDITGDTKSEIIVAPTGPSSVLFTIFDMNGGVLNTRSVNTPHSGASIDVSMNIETQKKDIVVAYRDGQRTLLERVSGDMKTLLKKVIPGFKSVVSVSAGDMDSNGEDEYILIAGAGDLPRVDWYSSRGTLVRRVSAFNSSDRSGIRGYVFDLEKGGAQELVATPRFSQTSVKVFDGAGMGLYDWTYDNAGALLIVPLE